MSTRLAMILGKFVPHVLLTTGLVSAGWIATKPEPTVTITTLAPQGPINPHAPVIPDASSLPNKEGEVWNPLVKTDGISIELDPSSVKITPIAGAFTVQSRFRMTFEEEFDVEGSKLKGWYYINTMTVNCTSKTLRIDKSITFTKQGKQIAVRENLGVIPKPRDPKSFVVIWVQVACMELNGVKPPMII